MIRKIRSYWYIFLIILAVIFLGLRQYQQIGNKEIDSDEQSYTVKRETLKETMTLSGKIDASEKVMLQFHSSGRLSWVGVKEGDSVSKYQTVATVDQRDIKKRLDKYLNTYLKYRWDFEQSRDDYGATSDTGISREIRDRAKRIIEKSQFELNNSVLDVELQDLALQYSRLTTPIAGIVTHIDHPIAGVNITALNSAISIVNPDSVYLSILADQTEVIYLSQGLTSEVVLDAFPDIQIIGVVSSLSFLPKQEESSVVYEVKVLLPLDNSNLRYRLGMTADASFTLKEKTDVLVVPISFINYENDKSFVTTGMGNKRERREIVLGEETDTSAEILSGLTEGDVVFAR